MSRRRRVGKGSPRFPPGAIKKMRKMRNEGASIDEIAEAFGTGKSTVWPHVNDIKFDNTKDIPEVPIEPERTAQKVGTKQSVPTVPPPPPPRVVTVNSEVQVEPELMGILAGLALKSGYPNLSEYLRKQGIPWLQAQAETEEELTNAYSEAAYAYKEAVTLRDELFRIMGLIHSAEQREVDRKRGRRSLAEVMALTGRNPDEIEAVLKQLERVDPSLIQPDLSRNMVDQSIQPKRRPSAPPPILLEEKPPPSFNDASRVPGQVGTTAQREPPQPWSPRDFSQQADVDKIRMILKRANEMSMKDKQGGAGRD